MKKFIIFLFVLFSLLCLVTPVHADYVDCTKVGKYCPVEGDTGFSYTTAGKIGDQPDSFFGKTTKEQDLNRVREIKNGAGKDFCLETSATAGDRVVSSIWNYKEGVGGESALFEVCRNGKVSSSYDTHNAFHGEVVRCCPADKPYTTAHTHGVGGALIDVLCCPKSDQSIISDDDGKCYDSGSTTGVAAAQDTNTSYTSLAHPGGVYQAGDAYSCGTNTDGKKNCRLNAQGAVVPDFKQPGQCTANTCVISGTKIGTSSLWCDDGQSTTVAPTTIAPTATAPVGYSQCKDKAAGKAYVECVGCSYLQLAGRMDEYNQCLACFDKDYNAAGTPVPGMAFAYSSIGCVDTSQNGIITRIFQIGIGLIGGVMIIRFIQAAFKMQTDNPEEIREAREIIASAVMALLVLVGAIVILRWLGVNVLNIVPSTFLSPT